MIKIRNENYYKQVIALTETFIQKVIDGGGFNTLKKKEADELQHLSLLAENYEDNIFKIMPLTVT
jgi:hypothetical protein